MWRNVSCTMLSDDLTYLLSKLHQKTYRQCIIRDNADDKKGGSLLNRDKTGNVHRDVFA